MKTCVKTFVATIFLLMTISSLKAQKFTTKYTTQSITEGDVFSQLADTLIGPGVTRRPGGAIIPESGYDQVGVFSNLVADVMPAFENGIIISTGEITDGSSLTNTCANKRFANEGLTGYADPDLERRYQSDILQDSAGLVLYIQPKNKTINIPFLMASEGFYYPYSGEPSVNKPTQKQYDNKSDVFAFFLEPIGDAAALDAEAVTVSPDPSGSFGSYYGDVQPAVGTFKLATVADPERKQPVLDLTLVPQKGLPDVIWEFTQLDLRKPVLVDAQAYEKVGLLVRGNGAFTQIMLKCRAPGGRKASVLKFEQDRSFVTFDGWQLLTAELPKEKVKAKVKVKSEARPQTVEVVSVVCGSAQKALDPIEMAPVTANLRLGAIVGVRRADAKAVDAGEGQARDTMKHVDEKDL